ncbi:MAG: RidA family protein [Candidatus Marinimicrobia bacterium]|nr:RidA family protein [Candidatus Neomarinimicrobiota bacterium]
MAATNKVSSCSPYEIQIGFSRAVRRGKIIAISGTAPILPDGSTAYTGDVYLQTRRCLEIIKQAIEEIGGRITDVIRTRVMLTDITQWKGAGKAHDEIFSDIKPACTFVEVKGFINPEWLVEIEADCLINQVE